ncbi:hypothetical protein CEP52_017342 [Fusarium oligoseptatum]|uniref:Uncharacterized protein n=1 Tax=Fusarium oligoseptatum TaxID=2604345 RepID=A0A428RTE5_9HYPO|nr:hypothetical protein CEP52_017342 [Fusarium oligoseptatum]
MASGLSDTCLPVLETLALTISVAHDFQYFVGPEIQALLSRLRHLRLSSTGSFERYLGPEYLFISQRDTYADVSRLVQGAGELRSLSVNAGQSEFFLRIIAFPPAESLSRLSLEHVHILGPSVNDLIQRSQRRLAVVHFKTCQLIAEEPESWRDIFDSLAECGNLLDLRFEKGSYFVEDGAVPDLDDEEDWDLVLPRDELSDSDIDALGELWGLVDKRRCDLGLDPLPGSDFLADLMTDVDGESAVAG